MIKNWLRTIHSLDIVFALMLLFAFVNLVGAVNDLEWSYTPDLYRDIGTSDYFINGGFPHDPIYKNEYNWYNPLLPGLVAFLSNFAKEPLYSFYLHLGPYLNIFSPIMFYVMVAYFFNRHVALASSAGYLFIISEENQAAYSVTYTAYLLTVHFSQALFYGSLILFLKALRQDQLRWYIFLGIILGFMFLSHTAPTIIFVGVFLCIMAARFYKSWDENFESIEIYRLFMQIALVAGLSLIIGIPLLYTIWGKYHLDIVYDAPGSYRALLDLTNLDTFITSQRTIFSAIGLVGLLGVTKRKTEERSLLLLWFGVSASLLAYDYAVQILNQLGSQLTIILPSWHFVVYLESLKVVCFGYGLWLIARFIIGLTLYLFPKIIFLENNILKAQKIILLIMVSGFLVARYPTYQQRDVFKFAREESKFIEDIMTDRVSAFHWVKSNTDYEDVFLSSDNHLSMFVIAQAGRKLTVAPPTFSNPYLDYESRRIDQTLMFTALMENDQITFEQIAAKYHLDFIVVSTDIRPQIEQANPPFLQSVFFQGEVRIYEWKQR